MRKNAKNIGQKVSLPTVACDDNNCPFHGTLKVHGHTFVGTVVSHKMQRSAVVSWESRRFITKYERYQRIRTKLTVHNPPCINAREGEIVKIAECRPLSKTKSFVIVGKVGTETTYELEKELGEEGRHRIKKKEEKNLAKKASEEGDGEGEDK